MAAVHQGELTSAHTHGNPYFARVANATTPEEVQKAYDDWAKTFNNDLGPGSKQEYIAPAIVGAKLSAIYGNLSKAIMLDAGCGTGLSGIGLAQAGAKIIDGVDISNGMLDVARESGVYRDLSQADLTQPMSNFKENTYDIVACVGTFTQGHVGPKPALAEFVRIAKSGGLVAATVREEIWESGGFKGEVDRLKGYGGVEFLEADKAEYRKGVGIEARLVVLRKK